MITKLLEHIQSATLLDIIIFIIILLLGIWWYFRYHGPIIVKYVSIDENSLRPSKAYGKAACFDLYATKAITVRSNQWRDIPTGLVLEPWPHIHFNIGRLKISLTPFGNVAAKLHTRSGHSKRGLRCHLGIIDNDYRGEITFKMFNHNTQNAARVREGDRVGQIEFYRVPSVWLFKGRKLSNSERGDRGFGSSGK